MTDLDRNHWDVSLEENPLVAQAVTWSFRHGEMIRCAMMLNGEHITLLGEYPQEEEPEDA